MERRRECTDCDEGTYAEEKGQTSCTLASAGFYVNDEGASRHDGQSSCSLADAGKYVDDDGASEQDSCPTGKYSGGGARECTDCDEGTYIDEKSQTSCTLASAGFYVDDEGASRQSECPAGRYSGSGAAECEKCSTGRYTDSDGQSSCSLADAGFYVNDDGASKQSECPVGRYSGSGASECTDCDEGTYASSEAGTSCTLASAGFYVDDEGASEQSACAAGRYSGSGAIDEIEEASTESVQITEEATSDGQSQCPAGTYSQSGASTCLDCDAGSYSDEPGQSSCSLADAGSYVPSAGATEQLKCSAGEYTAATRKASRTATETIEVLEADHDISCTSPSYKGIWSTYALAMLFVYPVGIPLLYFVELFRYRKHINPDVDESRLGEIEDSSDGASGCYQFVVFESTRTAVHIEDADDNLSNVGNAQIILVFIASLMLFIKDMDEQDGAR
ncbi:hypothetical protein JL721_9693 [Aureococcus anophagefferens]|nr:hypothetical protein JL721_9693 [Aureococcus anophagefferens]